MVKNKLKIKKKHNKILIIHGKCVYLRFDNIQQYISLTTCFVFYSLR